MKSGETKYTLQVSQNVPEQMIKDAFKKLPQDLKPDIPFPDHMGKNHKTHPDPVPYPYPVPHQNPVPH